MPCENVYILVFDKIFLFKGSGTINNKQRDNRAEVLPQGQRCTDLPHGSLSYYNTERSQSIH